MSNQVQALHHMISTFCITGYSIFVVMGTLPESEADQLLKLCPAKPEKKPSKSTAHTYVNKSDLTAALQQASRLGGEGKTQFFLYSLFANQISILGTTVYLFFKNTMAILWEMGGGCLEEVGGLIRVSWREFVGYGHMRLSRSAIFSQIQTSLRCSINMQRHD